MKKLMLIILGISVPVFAGINVTPGSGKTVHTDTVGGEEYQAVKIIDGTTGGTSSATVTSVGLKVDLSTTSVSGTVAATQSGAWNLNNSTVGVVGTVSAAQSGTWTVQPGNTANTTAWKVDGSAVTQPVSGTVGLSAGSAAIGQVNVISTNTLNVSAAQSGTWNLNNSTVGVVGTVAATQSGTWNLNNSTVGVVGTVAATQSGTWNVGTLTSITNALPAGAAALGQVMIISTNTLNVSAAQSGSWNLANSTVGVVGLYADNGVSSATNRTADLPGVYQSGIGNGVSGTPGNNAALEVGTDHLLHVANIPAIQPASYTASTMNVTSASTAGDIAALCGNAGTTVMVYGLRLSCTETTAGIINVTVLKRSTAYGGAWSTMTATADDSNYGLVQSTGIFFTANPTAGTLVGHLDNVKLGCMAPGTATANDIYIAPASWRVKPIILRGATQCLAVNLENQTVTGGLFSVGFDWMEIKTLTPTQ